MVSDELLELYTVERVEEVARACVGSLGALWDRCPVGCCPNLKAERPALCGEDA
jgi:ferrochelatase